MIRPIHVIEFDNMDWWYDRLGSYWSKHLGSPKEIRKHPNTTLQHLQLSKHLVSEKKTQVTSFKSKVLPYMHVHIILYMFSFFSADFLLPSLFALTRPMTLLKYSVATVGYRVAWRPTERQQLHLTLSWTHWVPRNVISKMQWTCYQMRGFRFSSAFWCWVKELLRQPVS